MRFEIRGGGVFAILLSLGILSGAVFFFGLLAGYDVGRQSQSATAEVATTYTIPSAPLAAASPVAAAPSISATPAAIAANDHRAAAATDESEAPPPAGSGAGNSGAADDDSGESAAAPSSPAAANTPARTASVDENTAPPDNAAGTSAPDEEAPPPPPKRHSFNIQIQAVMDVAGANQMIRRLSRIGYPAHMVATPIDGQTWYKVEVGPYPSQEEAATAQASMRQKYNDTYGSGHATAAGSSAAGNGAPSKSEE